MLALHGRAFRSWLRSPEGRGLVRFLVPVVGLPAPRWVLDRLPRGVGVGAGRDLVVVVVRAEALAGLIAHDLDEETNEKMN